MNERNLLLAQPGQDMEIKIQCQRAVPGEDHRFSVEARVGPWSTGMKMLTIVPSPTLEADFHARMSAWIASDVINLLRIVRADQ